jgi:hypothetical protein
LPPIQKKIEEVSDIGTTFCITHTFKGGTAEQYDRSKRVVHRNGGKGLPAGQTYHAAGETDDGLVVVALWDSEASWVKIRDEFFCQGWPRWKTG